MFKQFPYWPGETVGQFLTPAISIPSLSEFQCVAADYLAQVAPTLPPLAMRVLGNSVIESLFSACAEEWQVPQSLLPYERWTWPELSKRVPYSLDYPSTHAGHNVWGSEGRHHHFEARQLQRWLDETTFRDWFFSVRMTLVTAWRKEFFPDLKGRVRKVELQLMLSRLDPFPAAIREQFEAWQDELKAQIATEREKTNQPPVPFHLEWLAGLVKKRLVSHYYVNYSTVGPTAYDKLVEAVRTRFAAGNVRAASEIRHLAASLFREEDIEGFFLAPERSACIAHAKAIVLRQIERYDPAAADMWCLPTRKTTLFSFAPM